MSWFSKGEARVDLAKTEELIEELNRRGYDVSAKIETRGKKK